MKRHPSTAPTIYRLIQLLGVPIGLTLCWGALSLLVARPQPLIAAEPEQLISLACEHPAQTVFAAYQLWHGLPTHQQPPPYDSRSRDIIISHIEAAKARCIQGFVVDWYGRPDETLYNGHDRAFMDSVLGILFEEAAKRGFNIIIMYDEGTFQYWEDKTNIQEEMIADLRYAKDTYFQESAYFTINAVPMLFTFPYSVTGTALPWGEIRKQLEPVLLIDQDPNPQDWEHDQYFDGFYTWVKATNGNWSDGEWGEIYSQNFYTTMQTISYTNKIAVGGAWAGFDDTPAPWAPTPPRIISRTCGDTWQQTWNLVDEYQPPFVLISTWNDFEEGTDTENGIFKLHVKHDGPSLPGQRVNFLADFSGCKAEAIIWDFGDGEPITGTEAAYLYPSEGHYPVKVTATQDGLTITTNITVTVSTIGWNASLDPLDPDLWFTHNATWGDPPATLQETGPDTFGKAETIPLTIDVDKYPWLILRVRAIDNNASLAVQILNKQGECLQAAITIATNCAVDVLENITTPGIYIADLKQAMGWTGEQTFTVNLWISGDNKAVTIDQLRIGLLDSYLPIISNP